MRQLFHVVTVLLLVAGGDPVILGLHAINGLAIPGVTILLVRKWSRFAARPTAGPVLNPGRSRAPTSQP